MRDTLLTAIGVAALAASGAVFAAGGQQSGGEKGSMADSPHQAQVLQSQNVKFDDLDVNQDGKITRAEAQNYPDLNKKWDQINTDQDETLEKAEFAEFQQQLNKSGKPQGTAGATDSEQGHSQTGQQ